ncbi:hypothetical protein BYT27DRAFT_7134402 [Phlegmacium glaucopus]|nr:hypothetical protein BYT27DRAFT_7134402 [Phlegmacium glaucopus]
MYLNRQRVFIDRQVISSSAPYFHWHLCTYWFKYYHNGNDCWAPLHELLRTHLTQCPNIQHPRHVKHSKASLPRLLRITTIDSCIFLGTFAGTDKPLNTNLIDPEEYHISQGPGQRVKLSENRRYVGQVLLPWKTIVRVEVYERNNAMEKERRDRGDNIYL